LASTSPTELARAITEQCLRGEAAPEPLLADLLAQAASNDPAIASPAGDALFRGVAEALADRFEPALCDAYAELFSRVIARFNPEWSAEELAARYRRIRRPRRFDESQPAPETVFVLSRVTLGADIAITSIVLNAMRQRFPRAEIRLVSGRKSWELFAADPRLGRLESNYPRGGTLNERLAAGWALRKKLSRPGSIVIDPDSRLTQLGLLPVCEESNYYFFESRAYGGNGLESLSDLTRRWVAETFGVKAAAPYLALEDPSNGKSAPAITVSLGVGGNTEKRIPDPFEAALLAELEKTGLFVLVDLGAGGEESERVRQAIERSGAAPGRIATWNGSFAGFAARIARSRLYVGYDSAGQHAAAASGVPLVSIFAGYPCERFAARWRPTGTGPVEVIRVSDTDSEGVLRKVSDAARRLLAVA